MPAREPFDFHNSLPTIPERPDILSVTSLNKMARSLLEGHFPRVLVEGEISNLATPASGHWYLTLKDEQAQIRCAMFRNRNMQVSFKPRNGLQVLLKGRLSIYEGRGDYQLIVDAMEETGDGALRRAFEQLKKKLDVEGLFEPERKRPVSSSCRHVGVITSATGAAIQDIVSVFARRFPATRITVLPVAVQGKEAPGEIVAALDTANRLASQLGLEVLIVGRGGGSLEDLQAFNDESVARAIVASELPVVSAVGHEIDFTIADFVADLRAPTPSAAAELLSPNQEEYQLAFAAYGQQLQRQADTRVRHFKQQLAWLHKRLRHPGRRLQDHAQGLDILEGRLQRSFRQTLSLKNHRVSELNRTLRSNSPLVKLNQFASGQINLHKRLEQAAKHRLQDSSAQLQRLAQQLHTVSPLNTLARGYSITCNLEEKVLRTSDDVSIGETINTRLSDGSLVSKIVTVNKSGNSEI